MCTLLHIHGMHVYSAIKMCVSRREQRTIVTDVDSLIIFAAARYIRTYADARAANFIEDI